jgi:hypothetical protein
MKLLPTPVAGTTRPAGTQSTPARAARKRLKLICAMLAVLTVSCKDDQFYQLEKPNVFPYHNADNLELAAVSMYGWGLNSTWWTNPVSDQWFLHSIGSDELQWLKTGQASVSHVPMYYREPARITELDAYYERSYKGIQNVNNVLDFYEENGGYPFLPNKEAIDEKYRQNTLRIKGEGLFLRAYYYSLLASTFAPWYDPGGPNADAVLPLRLHFAKSYEEAVKPVMGTTGQVWDQMVADLLAAKELLPEKFDPALHNPLYNIARANKFVAAALLSRIYFWRGQHELALAELDYVIGNGPYALSQDPIDAWSRTEPITAHNTPEVLWYIPYSSEDSYNYFHIFTTISKLAWWGGNVSWREYALSYNALEKFGWMENPRQGKYAETEEARKDKRYTQLTHRYEPMQQSTATDPWPLSEEVLALDKYEPQLDSTVISKPMVWMNKIYKGKSAPFRVNVPLVRLAELYLTRSIIRFNKGDASGALEDLNAVRKRAGIGDLPGGLAALNAEVIHTERMKEMLQEGDRINYLRALRLPIPRGDRDGTHPNDLINPPYSTFYWPAPNGESNYAKK